MKFYTIISYLTLSLFVSHVFGSEPSELITIESLSKKDYNTWQINSIKSSISWQYNLNNPNNDWSITFSSVTPTERKEETLFSGSDYTPDSSSQEIIYSNEDIENLNKECEKIEIFLDNINKSKNEQIITIPNEQNGLNYLKQQIDNAQTILFWTGSGISVQAEIPSLLDLYKSLNIELIPHSHNVTTDSILKLKESILNSETSNNTISALFDFTRKLNNTDIKPTKAHYDLANIINNLKEKGKTVYHISSNLDKLNAQVDLSDEVEIDRESFTIHKKSALSISEFSASLTDPEKIEPDLLIILGLRLDDYGFARAVADQAQKTGKGEIISITRQTELYRVDPSYSSFSYYPYTHISADLQEIIPKLNEKINEKEAQEIIPKLNEKINEKEAQEIIPKLNEKEASETSTFWSVLQQISNSIQSFFHFSSPTS